MLRYNPTKIEKKWQMRWLKDGIYEPDLRRARKPFYNLMMFPYPSAEGLHIGAMRTFSGVDIYGRLKRMQGYDVFEPIGLDGFGIHSENYALKVGKHPMQHAKDSEKNFYRQLAMMGNGFAWRERLETYDPDYYRWTQWIFIQMFKRGLAYRKRQAVNWCPGCKTVLADEQVIQKSQITNSKTQTNHKSQIPKHKQKIAVGVCERCDTPVVKKELEQWFFRITEYADRLLKNLDTLDWSERVKVAQREWIGKSEGALIKFPISKSQFPNNFQIPISKQFIEVFTTRPDTLFGATYLVLGPEHPFIQNQESRIKNHGDVKKYIQVARAKSEEERIAEGREKTGVELKGITAINPANGEETPVWVADYVLGNVGTGAIMAVPAHDQRDLEFAKKYRLPIRVVVMSETQPIAPDPIRGGKMSIDSRTLGRRLEESKQEFIREIESGKYAYTRSGTLVNSGGFTHMDSEEAKWKIATLVGGKRVTRYHLRDWLISRQRYWAPPIPVIYCRKCREARNSKFEIRNKYQIRNTKYEIREQYGVDYTVIDGVEYAIRTVPEKDLPVKLPFIKDFRPTGMDRSPLAAVEKFYKVRCPECNGWARRETDVSDTFLDSAWYYLRYPSIHQKNSYLKIKNWKLEIPWNREITRRWLPVHRYIGGAEHSVLHLLYVRFLAMALHDAGLVHFDEPMPSFRAHGLITKDGAKMSKSKGNVVNPDEYIRTFGADAVRMYLAFMAPFEQSGDFRDSGIKGLTRFLERVWKIVNAKCKMQNAGKPLIFQREPRAEGERAMAKVQGKIENGRIKKSIHKTIKKVTEDIESLHYNTAISALMMLLNEFEQNLESLRVEDVKIFLKLLAPFAPHITEELWQQMSAKSGPKRHSAFSIQHSAFKSIHLEKWPVFDPRLVREDMTTVVLQVNGRVRDQITVKRGAAKATLEKAALASPKIQGWVKGGKPSKIIVVPDRLVNIVV